ncbi:MAG: 30S ribosomal protein S21 [bacterium]|nr:30S ribosomal protein S21 [bacterium]
MAVEVHRRRGESFDGLLRRFGRKVQMSGRLIQARKIRFFKHPKSKPLTRTAALKREKKKGYLAYLEKIGKLDEELEKMKAKKRFRRR